MSHAYSGGDILAVQKQATRPFWVDGVLNNGTAVDLHTVRGANHTIYVQKVVLSIITHANGKLAQVMDTNGTPKVIAKHIDATAAAGVPSVVTWDFGPHGVACTAAKSLQCVSEASGITGFFHVEGYEVKSATTSENGTANDVN